jgi:hypothetical protein
MLGKNCSSHVTVGSQDNRINADAGLVNRLGAGEADEHVQVKTIALPDLTIPQSIARDQNFSLFIPLHRRAAARLIEILMGRSLNKQLILLHYAVYVSLLRSQLPSYRSY